MLHNNGPFGPNDVPVNVNSQANMTDLSGQINSGHNINNLSKIAQPQSYPTNAHFNLSDYTSYGLNMNSTLSPFHNFHQVGYQSNLMSQNTMQDTWQPNVLPMNLNTQSEHSSHGYYDKKYEHHDFSQNYHKNMLNIPQVYPKPHKHIAMEANYPQYNHGINNFNHYFDHNLDLSVKSQRVADLRHYSDVSLDLHKSQKTTQNLDQLDLSNKIQIREEHITKIYESDRNYKSIEAKNIGNLDLSLKTTNSENLSSKSSKDAIINSTFNNALFTLPEKVHDFANINQNLDLSIKPQRSEEIPTEVDKPVIDHVRRRNLANTVKMIEDILSQTTNSKRKELERTETVTNFVDTDEEIYDINKKKHANEIDKIDDGFTQMSDKTCDSNSKADETLQSDDSNASTEISMISETKEKDERNNSQNLLKSVKDEDSESEMSDESDDDKSVAKMQSEKNVIKIEVAPDLEVTEHVNPFSKDVFAIQKEDITNTNSKIHDSELSVTIAKDIIKSGNITKEAYFECVYCNVYFNHPKRFLIHTKWHSFGLTYEKRMEMQKAKEIRKQMQKEARVLEDMKKHEITEGGDGKTYNCKECDKVFCKKASLKNHQQWYHPKRHRECKICNKVLTSWVELRDHHLTHVGESGFQCDDCPKRFKYSHSLAKHRDTHLEKTHGCPQCPKMFGSAALLHVHSKTHERMLRGATFRCTYCGKGFFESYHLQAHERTHRNERPFVCEICKTTFGTNSGLKRHLKVSHSTSKPFECTICHRSFISEAIRDRHEVRNHGDPEDFKFVCKQCPCRYLKQKDLRKHVYKVHPKGKRKKKVESDDGSE